MASQIITVDRKKYATGLFWQPVGAGFVPRNYARTLARSIDKKLNLYTEYRAMIGLAARRDGARSGMQSAAAEVAEAFAEYTSFLAVFKIGTRFFLVAVRNGIILEDRLFSNVNDARREYVRLAEIPDWNALFAPADWSMPRAVERNLSDVITNNSRAILRSISRVRAGIISVVLLALFGVLALGMFREPIHQMMNPRPQVATIDPELAAEYKRQIEEKNRELDAAFDIEKAPEPEPVRLPYDYLPDPAARADTCFRAIAFLMQPITGWDQVSAECGQTHANVEFKRGFGTLGDFDTVATELMPGAFVQSRSEEELVARVRLPEIPVRASIDERDAETVARAVFTAFQAADIAANVNIVMDAVTNGVETVQLPIVEVAAASKLTPQQFMRVFDEFGGVYMTRCTWNANSRTWNYEVIIYAK